MIEEFANMVNNVAAQIHRKFPMVDRDDLAGEMWLWMVEHQDKVESWAEDEKYGERKLARSIRRVAVSYALAEKAERAGYDVEDLFFYSTALLRDLLAQVFEYDLWIDAPTATDTGKLSRTSAPDEGNNRLAMLIDIKDALPKMREDDRTLLWTQFGMKLDDQEHALMLGITEEALRMRVSRALGRLQRKLGGARPDVQWVGTRRVISNAQAQALTRSAMEEE